jgi:hypothetical protein
VLLLAAGLLKAVDVTEWLPVSTALAALALASDLLFWSVNGFETTLLTALVLTSILLALRDAKRGELSALTCFLAGLLPVVRADAVDLAAAVVITAIALGARRRWWLLALAALPLIAHEAFRVTYYGDWFPNTYYLKVAGRAGLSWGGLGYAKGSSLSTPLSSSRRGCLAAPGSSPIGSIFAHRARIRPAAVRGSGYLCGLSIPRSMSDLTGRGSRSDFICRGKVLRWTMAGVLLLPTVFNAGVSGRVGFRTLVSGNGRPAVNTVTGVLLNRHAKPGSRVVVAPAGCLPYFSRLGAIDLLGKNDRHVARVRPATLDGTGHNRFDVDWSLRTRPDFVATFASHAVVSRAAETPPGPEWRAQSFYGAALLLNRTFIEEYTGQPVSVPFLLESNALFVHRDSPERMHLNDWRAPVVGRQ